MRKENAEVQSRRDFFKKAAKTVLPIFGIAVLANNPTVAKAAEVLGCTGTCHGACYGSCDGCRYTCSGTCRNSCSGTCRSSSSR